VGIGQSYYTLSGPFSLALTLSLANQFVIGLEKILQKHVRTNEYCLYIYGLDTASIVLEIFG